MSSKPLKFRSVYLMSKYARYFARDKIDTRRLATEPAAGFANIKKPDWKGENCQTDNQQTTVVGKINRPLYDSFVGKIDRKSGRKQRSEVKSDEEFIESLMPLNAELKKRIAVCKSAKEIIESSGETSPKHDTEGVERTVARSKSIAYGRVGHVAKPTFNINKRPTPISLTRRQQLRATMIDALMNPKMESLKSTYEFNNTKAKEFRRKMLDQKTTKDDIVRFDEEHKAELNLEKMPKSARELLVGQKSPKPKKLQRNVQMEELFKSFGDAGIWGQGLKSSARQSNSSYLLRSLNVEKITKQFQKNIEMKRKAKQGAKEKNEEKST